MKIQITVLPLALCIGCADVSSSTGQTPADKMPFSQEELKQTRKTMADLERPLKIFAVHNGGQFPDSLDALVNPPERNGIRNAPVLKELPTDPWGSPIQYRKSPREFWSLGPDKKEGNGDDISTWDVPDELRFSTRRGNESEKRQWKLAMIGAAMLQFHKVYGMFPLVNGVPRRVKEENGLSWRVHLLPYLGEKDLYKQFKLDEPWDSRHNQKLIEKMPDLYQLSKGLKQGETCLHLPTGPLKAPYEHVAFFNVEHARKWGEDAATRIRNFTDGPRETILAIVCGGSLAQPWTKPVDLPIDLKAPQTSLGNPKDGYAVIIADGTARFLNRTITDEVLRALLTRDGDDHDELPRR
jgi:hypothetical protein